MSIKADPTEFDGTRVLVSGGTKGAGRSTVDRFLAGGARAITAARGTSEPVDGVEFVQADLTTAEGAETLAKAALERLGGIDILAHVLGGSSTPGGGSTAWECAPSASTDPASTAPWKRPTSPAALPCVSACGW